VSKSNFICTIGKILKHKCLKWSCNFVLKLWTNIYGENMNQGSNFQRPFSSWWLNLPFPKGEKGFGKFDT